VKALLGDMALTQLRRDMRRLNQRIALLESETPQEARADENVVAIGEPAAKSGQPTR
jgi:hypothetical protein